MGPPHPVVTSMALEGPTMAEKIKVPPESVPEWNSWDAPRGQIWALNSGLL